MEYKDRQKRNEVRHDLYFTDASHESNFGYSSITDIRSECLHQAWYAFQDSVESVRVMALLPQVVVSSAIDHLLILTQATFNVLAKPVMDDRDIDPNRDAINNEYFKIEKDFFTDRHRVRQVLNKDLVMYNKWNLVNSPLSRGGFFGILEAQIVGVWTAFSVLTTELCIAAVNAQPKVLFNLGDREIKLKMLLREGGDSDWSRKMGELLRLFVRFDSHQNTADAYRALFRDAPAIVAAINSPAASVACLVKTQLAHDGGIVTDSFSAQAKTNKWKPWDRATVEKRLPLDGRNVGELCKNLINCANDLVAAVDNWLTRCAKQAAKSQAQTP